MATLAKPTIEVGPSIGNLGKFDVTVNWTVFWDSYDLASGQPYKAAVTVYGDDTWVPGDIPPIPPLPSSGDDPITSKHYTIYPGPSQTTNKTDTFVAIEYSLMNEDKAPEVNPNPDEIRASVTLTPLPAKVVTMESDILALQLA